MILFWTGAAALVAIALLFLLPPLLGRTVRRGADRDRMNVGLYHDRLAELRRELEAGEIPATQFEAAREELQRDLLNTTGGAAPAPVTTRPGRRGAVLVALALPLASLGVYWQIGAPDFVNRQDVAAAPMAGDLEMLVEKLKQRLEREPGDAEGWMLLGRSLVYMQRYGEAAQATGQAVQLMAEQPDPDLLAEYAETLALANDGSFAGKPAELLKRALALSPDNTRALWLAGLHAYQQRDVKTALRHWRRMDAVLPPDDEMAGPLREAIAEAEGRSGKAGNASR